MSKSKIYKSKFISFILVLAIISTFFGGTMPTVFAEDTELTGTVFGTSGEYMPGTGYDKVYDGNTDTYFDCTQATGAYAGIDLGAGNATNVTKIRFVPRSDWKDRMIGGKFQGSNTSQSDGFTDLYTITAAPVTGWNEVAISNATKYRYLRYIGGTWSYGNVCEVEFYTGTSVTPTPTPTATPISGGKQTGTVFGTTGEYMPGTGYDKVFDGNTGTYFDCTQATGAYAGIDLGEGNATNVTKIRFVPRTDWKDRMVGGKFQGSNISQTTGYTDIYTITAAPQTGWNEITISDATNYRYLRYIGGNWSYGNVCEVEFYSETSATPLPTPTPTPTPGGGEQPTPPGGTYPANKVSIIQPVPHSTINGNTWVAFYCPGAATAATMCWHQPDAQHTDSKGYLNWFSNGVVPVDASGWCTVLFPGDQFPHGPLNIEIAAWDSNGTNLNNYYLQVFNQGGVNWNAGLPDTPPAAQGMSLVFQDDFNTMPSISRTGAGATYASTRAATDVGEDYGDAICADYGGPYDPFYQTGTWLRIQAKKSPGVVDPAGWGRQYTSGMLTSERRDGTGIHPKYGYFECRMMCPDAPGTWPAFWLLNENNHDGHTPVNPGSTEYDLIEGYGGFPALYQCASHAWGTPSGYNTYNGPNNGPIDTNLYGGGDIAQTFHTYACKITASNIYFYFDNNLFCTQPTNYYAANEGMYFMINMELGGGWPIDLSRYGNAVDLWIDWVRVYQQ